MASMSDNDCTTATCPVDSGYFIMLPSLTGVVVILAAFALFAVVTFWELTRSKTTTYSLILITGLALDILGYVGTLLLRSDLASKTYFLVFLLGTTMGPTLITAAIYTVLPHIMALYGSDVSIGLSPGWIVCFLFLLDISTLFLQALGSAFAAEGFDKVQIEEGTNFIVAGLILQIMSILVFFGVYLCFMFRVAQSRQFLDPRFSYVYLSLKFKTTMLCLNLSLLFILVRTVARIVQFSSGLSSSLSQSQFYLPVLDGGLVLLAVFLLTIAHPPSAFGDAWTTTSPRNSTAHRDSASLHPVEPLHRLPQCAIYGRSTPSPQNTDTNTALAASESCCSRCWPGHKRQVSASSANAETLPYESPAISRVAYMPPPPQALPLNQLYGQGRVVESHVFAPGSEWSRTGGSGSWSGRATRTRCSPRAADEVMRRDDTLW